MRESEFWKIISNVQGKDADAAHAKRLKAALSQQSEERIGAFYAWYLHFEEKANTVNLEDAASLLNGSLCSDDGFLYFRRWLISRGKSVYYNAVNQPDSLAGAVAYVRKYAAQFELMGYVPSDLLRSKNASLEASLTQSIVGSSIGVPPNRPVLATNSILTLQRFTKLWALYGNRLIRSENKVEQFISEADTSQAVFIDGLGLVSVGQRLQHKTCGEGLVIAIVSVPRPVAVMSFQGGEKPVSLVSDFFTIPRG